MALSSPMWKAGLPLVFPLTVFPDLMVSGAPHVRTIVEQVEGDPPPHSHSRGKGSGAGIAFLPTNVQPGAGALALTQNKA